MDLAGKPDRDLEDDDTTLEEAFGNLGNPVVSTSKIDEFLAANTKDGRFICVVTSGGTQIALEQRAVRTLENFSTGLRGAIITETLLNSKQSSQYAVVLLVRKGAVLPFARHFSVKEFSDALAYSETTDGIQLGSVKAKESCKRLHEAHAKRRLLVVEYTTVQEYLFTLREVAKTSSPYGKRIMFCLAAAVSDFYIPPNELSSHKLETAGGTLTLRLHKVPKCLGLLRLRWAPSAFIVAFKLETDSSLLKTKSLRSINNYKVHLVVANILHTRYQEVALVSQQQSQSIQRQSQFPIEIQLSESLIDCHAKYLCGDEFSLSK